MRGSMRNFGPHINFKVNGKTLAGFPIFRLKYKGMFFLQLEDIDITSEDGMVYPYYKPLFFTERHPGQWILNITHGMRVFSLVFQKIAPYLAFEVANLKGYREVEEVIDED